MEAVEVVKLDSVKYEGNKVILTVKHEDGRLEDVIFEDRQAFLDYLVGIQRLINAETRGVH